MSTLLFDRNALKGRVAVVTGGSSGIGLAIVEALLDAGAAVALCGRNAQRLAQTVNDLRDTRLNGQIFASVCDVLDDEAVRVFARQSEEALGAASILINNAGQGRVSTFLNTTNEIWIDEFRSKFFSVINSTRAFLPQLIKQQSICGDASIVCINSLLARQPEPHMVATSAARSGLLNLVHSMAIEFALQRVRVNGVLLGLIESGQWRLRFAERENKTQNWASWSQEIVARKQIPLGRLGRPREAARAVVFLASPLASYITGTHLDVSGGLSRYA